MPRAAAGLMPADDLSAIRRRADAALPAAAREALRAAEARAFARAARAAKRRAEDCASDAADATDPAALERIADEAAASADGVAAVARLLAQPDGGAAALARECRASALKRAKGRSPKTLTLADAAAAAGADRPEGVELPEGSWKRFVSDNGLGDWLARTVDDSSLGLKRKSERIREKIASGRLAPPSGLPPGPSLIVGEDAALKAEGAEDAAQRVKDVWAASWAPGPLGARLRAGRALDYEGRVRVERIAAADASGLAFSRDPGSGRRERVLVEAVAGPLDKLLSGDAATETFALDRRSGREAAPRAGAGSAGLDASELARVARVARALDAWKGAGVEVAFSFEGKRLLVHHARALEAPRPVVPLNDPFAPRPEAQALDVKSVR